MGFRQAEPTKTSKSPHVQNPSLDPSHSASPFYPLLGEIRAEPKTPPAAGGGVPRSAFQLLASRPPCQSHQTRATYDRDILGGRGGEAGRGRGGEKRGEGIGGGLARKCPRPNPMFQSRIQKAHTPPFFFFFFREGRGGACIIFFPTLISPSQTPPCPNPPPGGSGDFFLKKLELHALQVFPFSFFWGDSGGFWGGGKTPAHHLPPEGGFSGNTYRWVGGFIIRKTLLFSFYLPPPGLNSAKYHETCRREKKGGEIASALGSGYQKNPYPAHTTCEPASQPARHMALPLPPSSVR